MKKEDLSMEEALRIAIEEAGEKTGEKIKMVVMEETGLHVISKDIKEAPLVIVNGDSKNLIVLYGYLTMALINDLVEAGNRRSGIEKAIIETTKYAIARAREKETKENGK